MLSVWGSRELNDHGQVTILLVPPRMAAPMTKTYHQEGEQLYWLLKDSLPTKTFQELAGLMSMTTPARPTAIPTESTETLVDDILGDVE